jgi:hypothetical protein
MSGRTVHQVLILKVSKYQAFQKISSLEAQQNLDIPVQQIAVSISLQPSYVSSTVSAAISSTFRVSYVWREYPDSLSLYPYHYGIAYSSIWNYLRRGSLLLFPAGGGARKRARWRAHIVLASAAWIQRETSQGGKRPERPGKGGKGLRKNK